MDLSTLPFKEQSKSCINIFGSGKKHIVEKLEKINKTKIESYYSWNIVKDNVKFVDVDVKKFPNRVSKYLDSVRNGATLIPNCLIKIATKDDDGNNNTTEITTVPSRHRPWKELGTRNGNIPKHWVCDVVTSNELLPYHTSELSQFTIPLSKTRTTFDDSPMDCNYWRNVDGIYKKHMGAGGNTPKTLLNRLNHHKALEKQLNRESKYLVVYNSSGIWLYASIMPSNTIVEHMIYTVSVKSKDEALFLTALLNADVMQEAYQNTRKSDRHFNAYFWSEVPLPRFNPKNKKHVELAKLAKEAITISEQDPIQKRKDVSEYLRENGISAKIDDIIKKLLPEYVSK